MSGKRDVRFSGAATVAKTSVTIAPPVTKSNHQGMLYKHANYVKGFQYRYFVVNMQCGRLEYYLSKEDSSCRGFLQLAGSEVAPSDEDSVTFTVFAVTKQIFRLKAESALERKLWVDAIRAAVEQFNQAVSDPLAVKIAPRGPKNKEMTQENNIALRKGRVPKKTSRLLLPSPELVNARESLMAADVCLRQMTETVANYPFKTQPITTGNATSGEYSQVMRENYELVLKIKAYSVASLQDLQTCFEAVQSEYFRYKNS